MTRTIALLSTISLCLVMVACTEGDPAETSSPGPATVTGPIAPAAADAPLTVLDDSEYDIILKDSDRWYIKLKITADFVSRTRFTGVLEYSNYRGVQIGVANALYLPTSDTFLISAEDAGTLDYTDGTPRVISYSLTFTNANYLSGQWVYLWKNKSNGNPITAILTQGSIDGFTAPAAAGRQIAESATSKIDPEG